MGEGEARMEADYCFVFFNVEQYISINNLIIQKKHKRITFYEDERRVKVATRGESCVRWERRVARYVALGERVVSLQVREESLGALESGRGREG